MSIFGPAGVGKSTLAAEFGRIAADGGARVVRGRSLPYRESGTYGVLATPGDEAGRGVRERPGGGGRPRSCGRRRPRCSPAPRRDADAVSGHLGVLVGVDAGAEAADREALFYSIREFLEAVAREQPTILVFEDVHWADDNMLDLIRALATRVRGLPILFVTLSRPELLDQQDDWGSGVTGYTALTLGPLDEAHARELTVRRLGERRPGRGGDPRRRGQPAVHRAARGEHRRDAGRHAADERPRDRRRAPGRAAAR